MDNSNKLNVDSAAEFMRHASSTDEPITIDPKVDPPIIISQIHLANMVAELLNDHLELDENPANFSDILDIMASLGIVMSSIDDYPNGLNYASLAYFYSINNTSIPEVTNYLLS